MSLYVPYVKWAILFLLLHNVFIEIGIYSPVETYIGQRTNQYYSASDTLIKLLHILLGMNGEEQLLGGFWFLQSIFWGNLFFYFLCSINKKTLFNLILLFLLVPVTRFFWFNIPFMEITSREIMAAFFICAGYYYRNSNTKIEQHNRNIIIFILLTVLCSLFIRTDMKQFWWKNSIPYMLTAFTGIFATLCISRLIYQMKMKITRFLMFAGDNSLSILTWHFSAFCFGTGLIILFFHLPHEYLAHFPTIKNQSPYLWIFYSIIGIMIPLLFCFFNTKLNNEKKN